MSHIPNAAMPHAETKTDGEHAAKHDGGEKPGPAAKDGSRTTATSRAVDVGAWVALGLGLGAGTLALVRRLAHRAEGEQATPERQRDGD